MRKAPELDEIPTKTFKEMDERNRGWVLEILNTWWREGKLPDEMVRARVVLLYKKRSDEQL